VKHGVSPANRLAHGWQRGYTNKALYLPDLLSLLRVPLGVAFVPLAGYPTAALTILALAAVSDMLDGWLARRKPHPKGMGQWLDPVCDKIFITTVMAGLYLSQHPSLEVILPILTREVAILMLFLVYRLVPAWRTIRYDYSAHTLGKATTVTQFLVAAALLLQCSAAPYLAILCALLGLLCAAAYAKRGHALVHAQKPQPP
jgi:cardiolipin synthase (CMP-forming)